MKSINKYNFAGRTKGLIVGTLAGVIINSSFLGSKIASSEYFPPYTKEIITDESAIESSKRSLEEFANSIRFVNYKVLPDGRVQTLEQKTEEYIMGLNKPLSERERIKLIDYAFRQVKAPGYITRDYFNALIKAESGWIPGAISEKGAMGLGQLTDSAVEQVEEGVSLKEIAFNPEENLLFTLKYLKWQVQYCERFYPDWEKLSDEEKRRVLTAGFNEGIPRLVSYGEREMPYETRNHVNKIHG